MDFENQRMLEELFNARQTPKLIRERLLQIPDVVLLLAYSELPEDFALDLMHQLVLAKRATVPTLVGQLKRYFLTRPDPFQACADALYRAAECDLIDWDPERDQFVVRWDVDAATHQLIRQYQYLPPMIVPPLEILDDGTNRGSGYLTVRSDSLLLRDNHHDGDICVDSLNRFNRIPLSINIDVVKSIRNEWKNIDSPKEDEPYDEFVARRAAFERYEKESFFTIALMVEMGNRFHLTHKPDKRGRTYAQGYHINPQGNVWNKACVELADKEVLAA